MNNQRSDITEGQNPEAGPTETERIRDMDLNSVAEKNKTNVKNREMIYTYDQMFQMFQSLSEDSKQKVGELIVSLSGKT